MNDATLPRALPRTLTLDECREHPLNEVGGKAQHLARAMAWGHPIPPGAVIPRTELAGGVTEALLEAVWQSISATGDGCLAVRSSGIAEDGAEHSFAGQFATLLNVRGREALADALRVCHASAASAQVRVYGDGGAQPIAILVQRQVDATCAGVAFSANPVTGARDEVVINAVRGLGDRLVSGEVTPEELAVKEGAVTRCGTSAAVLDDGKALDLARTVRQLEEQFGGPQDVEWAYEGDALFVLQSRPITALPPAPVPVPFEPPPGSWTRNDHHTTLSPMAFGLFCEVYDTEQCRAMRKYAMPVKAVRSEMIGGHLYTAFEMEGGEQKGTPPDWVMWLVARLVPVMRRMNREAKIVFDGRRHHQEMIAWEEERKPYFSKRIGEFDPSGLAAFDDVALMERWRSLVDFMHEGARAHADTMGNWIAIGEFCVFCRTQLGWDLATCFRAMNGWSRATTHLRDTLIDLCRRNLDEDGARKAVARIAGGDTSWMAEHPAFQREFEAWRRANALRMQSYDFHNPTLGESPALVLRSLHDALAVVASGGPDPRAAVAAGREILHDEARRQLAGTPLLDEFQELARWCERAYGYRDENGAFTIASVFGLVRLHLLEIGRRIEGLERPEHVFYVRPEELEAAFRGELADLPDRIAHRRGEEQWARFHRGPKQIGPPEAPLPGTRPFPPPLRKLFDIVGWMMELEMSEVDTTPPDDRTLVGRGVSGGTYTGTARLVNGPGDFQKLLPGDVMVCRITSGEWSIAFGQVGALITEEGGFLSHPAIIAREFGIPAVTGTDTALQRIADGATVRVDGTAGRVTLIG